MVNMKKEKESDFRGRYNSLMDYPLMVIAVAVLSIALGFVFIFIRGVKQPIPREEAVSYCGKFSRFVIDKHYCEIQFEDGKTHFVNHPSDFRDFRDKMQSLAKGENLYLLINPNNDYAVEIRTDTEEILSFEKTKRDLESDGNYYLVITVFCWAGAIFLIWYVIADEKYKKKESAKQAVKKASSLTGQANSPVLRMADESVKCRILLEARAEGYHICYRRVKSVNELVVNGRVYDEKAGVIEFAHKLSAMVDGHRIEAGLDTGGYSFIILDGNLLKHKRRWI